MSTLFKTELFNIKAKLGAYPNPIKNTDILKEVYETLQDSRINITYKWTALSTTASVPTPDPITVLEFDMILPPYIPIAVKPIYVNSTIDDINTKPFDYVDYLWEEFDKHLDSLTNKATLVPSDPSLGVFVIPTSLTFSRRFPRFLRKSVVQPYLRQNPNGSIYELLYEGFMNHLDTAIQGSRIDSTGTYQGIGSYVSHRIK